MKPCHNTEIRGSCRGFLLLNFRDSLCLWNPSTSAHKFVDCPPTNDKHISLYGFGYDPSTDDYLVVIAFSNYNDDRLACVDYFSLRANNWKQIETTHLPYRNWSESLDDDQAMHFLNNAVHWLAYDISIDVIVAFDLTHKSFFETPLPVGFDSNNILECALRVLGKLLNLCTVDLDYSSVQIWVMKEYKVQSSWIKTILVSFDDIPTRYFFPTCSIKSDVVAVDATANTAKFVKCNDKGQLLEHRCYCHNSNGSPAPVFLEWAAYTESLISLPCDSEQAEEVD